MQLSMTDLGGTLDILSTFRPSEKLLLDLYRALDILSDQLGDAGGIVMIAEAEMDERDEAMAFLERYGITH